MDSGTTAAEPLPGSRQRLISAATRLFSRQGYEATGVKHIAEQASAPMGSFYFHFPGGKEELGVAALDRALTSVEAVEDALPACARLLAEDLPNSEWADGCPVATTALESVVRSPALRAAAAAAFQAWEGVIRNRLIAGGLSDRAAAELASTALALLEGAEMLARVHADPAPLHHAAASLRALTLAAVGAPQQGGATRRSTAGRRD